MSTAIDAAQHSIASVVQDDRQRVRQSIKTLIDAQRLSKKRRQEKRLPNSRLKMIMPSLPAAASNSDCRRRSHPDCRAIPPIRTSPFDYHLTAFALSRWPVDQPPPITSALCSREGQAPPRYRVAVSVPTRQRSRPKRCNTRLLRFPEDWSQFVLPVPRPGQQSAGSNGSTIPTRPLSVRKDARRITQ